MKHKRVGLNGWTGRFVRVRSKFGLSFFFSRRTFEVLRLIIAFTFGFSDLCVSNEARAKANGHTKITRLSEKTSPQIASEALRRRCGPRITAYSSGAGRFVERIRNALRL